MYFKRFITISERRTRTFNLLIQSQMLYQLSYFRISENIMGKVHQTNYIMVLDRIYLEEREYLQPAHNSIKHNYIMVPGTGLEPAHRKALGSKPSMSTNSITPAYDIIIILIIHFAGAGIEPAIFGLWARRDTVSPPRNTSGWGTRTRTWTDGFKGRYPTIRWFPNNQYE